MTISNITDKINAMGQAWEEFKSANDERLSQIEKRGEADPLTAAKVSRMNDNLDGFKSGHSNSSTKYQRPILEVKSGSAHADPMLVGEHKSAFAKYLRTGVTDDLALLEQKALSVGSDVDGGFLVNPQMSDHISRAIFESSPMRQIARIDQVSSDTLEIIDDHGDAGSEWTASESAAVSDSTTPEVNKKVIAVHELSAQPKATQKLIDDASIDVEAWLADKITDAFNRKENAAFINGDGVGKPRGILSYNAGDNWGEIEQLDSGEDGSVTSDAIIRLYYALKEDYATHANFLMNRATIQQVRLLKEATTNQYLWQPSLTAGNPDTLLGVPVRQAADMPIPVSNSISVAVGDFSRAYQIVDRVGVRVLRDPFTEKPFVKFYTTKRVGGDVVNFEAIKLMKLSA